MMNMEMEERDPSEIPEDIREYIKKIHKQQIESRPDENWRMARNNPEESAIPYKRDSEDIEAAEEDIPGMAKGGVVSQDALDLADIAASGAPIAADPEMLQAALDAQKGGPSQDAMDLADIASSGVPLAADPEMLQAGLDAAKDGPSQDALDLADIAGSGVPIAADPEMIDAALKAIAAGKEIPGYAAGGLVDQNDLLNQLAPTGTGVLSPSPAANAPTPPQVQAPMPPPAAARETIQPAVTAPTEDDYMAKANRTLGFSPEQQAGFLKMLGDRSGKAQIGAGIAGIGDALASGGTLGKVNPGQMQRAEDLISNRERTGLEGMQTLRGNQEKAFEVSQKLQAQDPKSPLSRFAQKQYASLGKKIGIDLSQASAAMISDIAGKGVEALVADYNNELKKQGLDLQRATLDATKANQSQEHDIARQGRTLEAAKALASRGPLDKLAGLVPFTAAHDSKKVLQGIANQGSFAPDVLSYAQKHNISPEEAQAVKDRRMKSQ